MNSYETIFKDRMSVMVKLEEENQRLKRVIEEAKDHEAALRGLLLTARINLYENGLVDEAAELLHEVRQIPLIEELE